MWAAAEVLLVEYGLIFNCRHLKRLLYSWSIVLLFFFFSAVGAEHPSDKIKTAIAPYLMPEDHPIKPLLDSLFSSSRVILNLETLEKAGFAKAKPRKFTKLIVTKHPSFPGYIFKLYLDAQRFHKNKPEYYFWLLRAKGADKVRAEIARLRLENSFKVPQKWIFQLPEHPSPPEGYYTKYYILVEEDMDIVSKEDNEQLWASSYVTNFLLDGLFAILKKVGLGDCVKPDNIPFSIDGRVAFIDTQTHGSKHVKYKDFTHYLSKPNQTYWKIIIED